MTGRLAIGDNLPILRQMKSETIDLIYGDPPFNTGKRRKGKPGTLAEGLTFDDAVAKSDKAAQWQEEIAQRNPKLDAVINAAKLTHGKRMAAHLAMISLRLIELRRILKPTGSLYLHCDPTAGHYLKVCLDAVFGPAAFRAELVWHYNSGGRLKTNATARPCAVIPSDPMA